MYSLPASLHRISKQRLYYIGGISVPALMVGSSPASDEGERNEEYSIGFEPPQNRAISELECNTMFSSIAADEEDINQSPAIADSD
jgi:hypothetical protein